MTFIPHSLTLHFREEDEELWEVLKRLSHDQQDVVVKEALLQYLKDHPERLCTGTTRVNETTSKSSNEMNRISFPSEWKLDALFVSSEIEKDVAPFVTRMSNPLRHLFDVIGEEEDEEIIQFLSASEKPPLSNQKEDDSRKGNNAIEIDAMESYGSEGTSPFGNHQIEVLQEPNLGRISGLSFILQQLIGEEEEEEVLQFFENTRNGESNS